MKKFRLELMKVISEANKRENKINDLKQFISAYEQVKGLNKIKKKIKIKKIRKKIIMIIHQKSKKIKERKT